MKAKIGDSIETNKGRTTTRKGWRIRVTEIQLRVDGGADLTGYTGGGRRVTNISEKACRPCA